MMMPMMRNLKMMMMMMMMMKLMMIMMMRVYLLLLAEKVQWLVFILLLSILFLQCFVVLEGDKTKDDYVLNIINRLSLLRAFTDQNVFVFS